MWFCSCSELFPKCDVVLSQPSLSSKVQLRPVGVSTSTIELLFAGMILFWLALWLVGAVTDSVLDLLIGGQRAH